MESHLGGRSQTQRSYILASYKEQYMLFSKNAPFFTGWCKQNNNKIILVKVEVFFN